MNASSGLYNVNAYNLLCNNATILSSLSVGGVDIGGYINNNNTNLSNINLSINALTNPTILNVNKLNVSQTSVLNGAVTCMSTVVTGDYIQAPQVSLLGVNPSFSMGGNVIGTKTTNTSTLSTSANIGDMIVKGNDGVKLILQTSTGKAGMYIDAYNNVVMNNPMTCISTLNISGNTTINNDITVFGTLNVSGTSTLKDINMGTGTSKLTTSIIHLANNNLDTGNYGARIVSLYNGVNGHNLQFQTRDTPTGAFENNFVISSSGNVSVIKDIKVSGKLGVGTALPNNVLEVSGVNPARVSDYRLYGEPSIEFVKGKVDVVDKTFGSDFHTDWKIKNSIAGSMEFYRKRTSGNGYDLDGVAVTFSNDGDITCNTLNATNVMKKKSFQFVCSTPVTLNGTTYYRYDIDLNLYTTFYSRMSGSTLLGQTRKFKWMSWLATGVHDLGYDLNYDISYSFKNTLPNIGLSVCAYGWPYDSKSLTSVNTNGPFLLRNTFTCVTFCCSVQNTVISAIIIDYL